jgi:hypothetical protein
MIEHRAGVRGLIETMHNLRALLAWDSLLLFGICMLDMLSTLYWVNAHVAVEMNPYMNFWLRHGYAAFCLAKISSFLPLLIVAAAYRERRPRLIRHALRGSIVLYLAIYVASVAAQMS